MAAIEKRGGSYRVKIFDRGSKPIMSRSFTNEADAKAWGEAQDDKVAFRRKHGDFVLHPSGSATYITVASGSVTSGGTLSKLDGCSKAEAQRYLAAMRRPHGTPLDPKRVLAAFFEKPVAYSHLTATPLGCAFAAFEIAPPRKCRTSPISDFTTRGTRRSP